MKYWQGNAPVQAEKPLRIADQILSLLLVRGPMTGTELHHCIGHGRSTVSSLVSKLYNDSRLRIVDWRRNTGDHNGRFAPIYGIADGEPDALPPAKLTRSERDKNYLARRAAGLTRPWRKQD